MQNSNVLIAQALSTLKGNIQRTGDPLGFTKPYWSDWATGLALPQQGHSVLMTARMYQMLPFVQQATTLTSSFGPLLPLLGSKVFRKIVEMGYKTAGEAFIRFKARSSDNIREKGDRALQGIGSALCQVGANPAYLYDKDPYSGVLLYDLGLEADAVPHMHQVYRLLKAQGAREVITTDPHTTYMLKEVYPRHIAHFDLRVRHYLEILSDHMDSLTGNATKKLPETMVMHDSCVMTRDLGIIDQTRRVATHLGIKILEPENTGQNTACCGGPVEYAYADLSAKVSNIRIKELAAVSRDILVACPICLLNLSKYEATHNVKIWDMGELLYMTDSRFAEINDGCSSAQIHAASIGWTKRTLS
jgi:hypothetical protein